jgi:hypothetical protein
MTLFEEYVDRYAAGERPDLREYLDRAGDDRDELARLASGFLQWAEAPEPDEDAVAIAQAWIEGEAPLVALRVRRGLRRQQIVEWVMDRFGFASDLERKVERRYHELETGQLDVRRVDPALLEGLAELLHTRVADLAAWKPRPLRAEAAYYRENLELNQLLPASPADAEGRDEVDRLFGVGT